MSDPARHAAVGALVRIDRAGERPGAAIEGAGRGLAPRDRRFSSRLVFEVVRHRRLIDHLLDGFLRRPGGVSAEMRNILRIGVCQLFFMDGVPDRAAVHSTVELARGRYGSGMASLANAVLRKIQASRGIEALSPEPEDAGGLAVRHSFPDFMVRRWLARFGPGEAGELLEAMNLHPPLTMRVNSRAADRDSLAERLAGEGVNAWATHYAASGLVLGPDRPLEEIEAFRRGLFSIQDEAFQLIGELLPVSPGQIMLDAFAGLGGKSTHLAQRVDDHSRIVAADLSRGKLFRLKEEADRLGLKSIRTIQANALNPPFREKSFDAILLDVPCTGTGVIRRRPDIKWNRREEDLSRLQADQIRFLEEAAAMVKPGGSILYATCSLEPEENQQVVMHFLEKNDIFHPVDLAGGRVPPDLVTPEGFFQSLPHRHGMDGAFAALLCSR